MNEQVDPNMSSFMFTVRDGLRLHMRRYGPPSSQRPPVLCLAGLTRNSRDFHELATALASGADARIVYALDSRGRGLSECDSNWRNYTIASEMHDVVDLAAMLGLHGASIIGTSRGGLLAMALATVQPGLLGAVVLNDIGPVIEFEGLARIAGYIGRMSHPKSWLEATETVADTSRGMFPDLTADDWEEVAHAWYNEENGQPVVGFDPNIMRTFAIKDGPVPPLWPQFTALARVPVLVIRGALSDILSAATYEDMLRRHPRCTGFEVPRQGHAPFLRDQRSIQAIAAFLRACEAGQPVAGQDFTADDGPMTGCRAGGAVG